MSTIKYAQIEKIIDEKMTEFNDKRVKALQGLSFEDILDFNPILFVFRGKYSLPEIAHSLVDRKLMVIEQKLLEDLFTDLSGFIGEKMPITNIELQQIISRVIRKANIFEGIDNVYVQVTYKVMKRLFEYLNKLGSVNWAEVANLSSDKCGLEKLIS